MNRHTYLLALLCTLMNISFVSAQDKIETKLASVSKVTRSIYPHESVQSTWDMKFRYYASLNNNDLGNAGITYVSSLNEIWTSHWSSNLFYRWPAYQYGTKGIFDSVYKFTVNGVINVRGMTFDGNFVYAVNNSDTVFKISPVSPTLVGVIIVPIAARYITFDQTANQGKGGFWIGNFETDAQLIDYSGHVQKNIPYANLGTTVIYGAAFDNYSPNGPYLWFFGQTAGETNPQEISQVSLLTGNTTGVLRNINPDFSDLTDSSLAGGLFVANGLVPGSVILGGINQCPGKNLMFGYEIAPSNSSVPFAINKSFSFGDPKVSSSYRIISLPGNINFSIPQFFNGAGEQKKDWDVYDDNGQTENYLVEYSSSNNFSFTPGRAFWIVSKNQLNISRQANFVGLNTANSYSIPLHSGWNLIGDPFSLQVQWNSVKVANKLANNELIYAWNGSWSNPSVMQPYDGYYYNNINNLTSLNIPFPYGKSLAKAADVKDYGLEKFIKISLTLDNHEYSAVYAAIKNSASYDFDSCDYFCPPSDFSELDLFVRDENLRTTYKNLFIDSRPEIKDGQIFDVHIKNTASKDPILNFSGIENFKDYEIYFVDKNLDKFYDLKRTPKIKLSAIYKKSEFSLLIGKKSFIEERKNSLSPQSYSLLQNYPNPFNPATVIRYELPEKNRVELKVYDVIGKEVAVLVNEEQSAGIYEVVFNAEKLSSGIYFYSLRAGNFVKTQKMVLLR